LRTAGRLGLVAAVGLLVGIATQIGQSVLPDGAVGYVAFLWFDTLRANV
jgi:hypothetical protein